MKIKNLLETFASSILGVLMLFFGIYLFDFGNAGTIVYGVFALLFGLTYLAVAILRILKLADKVPVLKSVFVLIEVLALPFLYFIETLIDIIDFAQIEGLLGASDWILAISFMAAILFFLAAAIVKFLLKASLFQKLQTIAFAAFVGILALTLVFPIGGGVRTIGNLTIYEVLTLFCYGVIALQFLEGSEKASAEEEEAEPEEEAAEPEPVEEEPLPEEKE